MARVAVLHNTLDFHGGADVVCLRVCEALTRDHDVALCTISETTPALLADRFGVDIEGVTIRRSPAGPAIAGLFSRVTPHTGPQLAFRSTLLRTAFRSVVAESDLVVSTTNELSLPAPSVQYVHYPQFHERRRKSEERTGARAAGWLNACWGWLAAPSHDALASEQTTVLANSAWTAGVVADTYGIHPGVLHPPVDPIACDRDWGDREDGIVAVGRLAPDKRLLDAIDVVDAVRERGYDVHLHVVGTAPRSYQPYADQVEREAARRPHVTLERDVPRARLEALLCTHKYGLNMKEREPFGMSVAEYVAAGMQAFAPDSGGQREILDEHPDRLFSTHGEAVTRLVTALEADEPPGLPRNRFSSERFASGIRDAVSETLAQS